MKGTRTIEVTVRNIAGQPQARVYVCRPCRWTSRIYHYGYPDEKCISLASVQRAMRLQAAMLEVKP